MRREGNHRGWYWGWLGGLLSLIVGACLALAAIVLEIRNVLGTASDSIFQLASVMALSGIAFIVLGLAIRQSCSGCCDWYDEAATNTRLERPS